MVFPSFAVPGLPESGSLGKSGGYAVPSMAVSLLVELKVTVVELHNAGAAAGVVQTLDLEVRAQFVLADNVWAATGVPVKPPLNLRARSMDSITLPF